MKQLDAFVLTFNLDQIKEELRSLGVTSITLSDAASRWRTRGLDAPMPAVSTADFLPRIQMRVVVPDHLVGQATEILRRGE